MRFRHLCWVCTVAALLGLSLSFPGYADRLQEILEAARGAPRRGSGLPPSGFAVEGQPPSGRDVDLAAFDRSRARLTDQVEVAIVVISASRVQEADHLPLAHRQPLAAAGGDRTGERGAGNDGEGLMTGFSTMSVAESCSTLRRCAGRRPACSRWRSVPAS